MNRQPPAQPAHPLVRSAQEAQVLFASLAARMNELIALVQHETDLVRAGKLADAGALEPVKADLSRRYTSDAETVRFNAARLKILAPDAFREAMRAHDTFRAVLQINLTVLATAHAVSEGLLRGVAGELSKKAAPSAYSAFGRTAPQPRSAAQPIAVSRSL